MAKAIVSRPGFAFASMIAWRNEPAPESFVFATVNVDAASGAHAAQTHAMREIRRMKPPIGAGRGVTWALTPSGPLRGASRGEGACRSKNGRFVARLQSEGLRDEDGHLKQTSGGPLRGP